MPPSPIDPASFQVSAPAVVPLFGDQQHYLGLPLVTLALSLRYELSVERRADRNVVVESTRDRSFSRFRLDDLVVASESPDTPRGILHRLQALGFALSAGCNFAIHDTGIEGVGLDTRPTTTLCLVGACMVVSGADAGGGSFDLCRVGCELSANAAPNQDTERRLMAATAGGLLFCEPQPPQPLVPSRSALRGFVIGYDKAAPNALEAAERCRHDTLGAVQTYAEEIQGFDFRLAATEALFAHLKDLPEQAAPLVFGHILNRNTCLEAIQLLRQPNFEPHELGRLLDDQHAVRRDYWGMSSQAVEALIDSARRAGALGCTGHGLSGGIIAYAPKRQRQVAQAIERAGGIAVAVNSDTGLEFGPPQAPRG